MRLSICFCCCCCCCCYCCKILFQGLQNAKKFKKISLLFLFHFSFNNNNKNLFSKSRPTFSTLALAYLKHASIGSNMRVTVCSLSTITIYLVFLFFAYYRVLSNAFVAFASWMNLFCFSLFLFCVCEYFVRIHRAIQVQVQVGAHLCASLPFNFALYSDSLNMLGLA